MSRIYSVVDDLDRAFGRHVHWGYWPDPKRAKGTALDFAEAAEALSRRVYQSAGIRGGQKILDAGCGFGGTLASLNENYRDLDLTGLNIDARQIDRAEQKVRAADGNSLRFVEGNACDMPFADSVFDVVTAVECIFHFPSRRDFFAEVFRVLKPGGALAICDFVPRAWFRRYTASQSVQRTVAPLFGPMHMDHTLADYRRLGDSLGFQSILEEEITANTIPTYPFLRKLQSSLGDGQIADSWGPRKTEWVSRLGWIGYWILAWRKPA